MFCLPHRWLASANAAIGSGLLIEPICDLKGQPSMIIAWGMTVLTAASVSTKFTEGMGLQKLQSHMRRWSAPIQRSKFWPRPPHLSTPKIISCARMIQTSAQQRN